MKDIKQDLLINEQIRYKEVQVIDDQGQKLGKLSINEALELAASKDLDLVLVSGQNPENPVCKIMNYGKHKFEQAKREKESRKKQKTIECKELRVTPNIEIHDFTFKEKNEKKTLMLVIFVYMIGSTLHSNIQHAFKAKLAKMTNNIAHICIYYEMQILFRINSYLLLENNFLIK